MRYTEEGDYAKKIELSNFSEMNARLKSIVDLMLNKAEESAAELQAEKEEKAELMKKLQELADAKRQAKFEADNAKRIRQVEAENARLFREAEAAKKIKAAEDEKAALLRLIEEQATAEKRAETKRRWKPSPRSTRKPGI